MSITLELLRDLALLEKIIVAVETAAVAQPGQQIAQIKGDDDLFQKS